MLSHQLKLYVNEHFIPDLQYKQEIMGLDNDITQFDQQYQEAFRSSVRHYERFVEGEISKEEFRAAQDAVNEKKYDYKQNGLQKTVSSVMQIIESELQRNRSQRDYGLY